MYPRSGKNSGSMLQPSLRISPVPTKQIFYHPLNAVSRYSHPVGNTSYPGNVTFDTLGTCLNDVSTIINLRLVEFIVAGCSMSSQPRDQLWNFRAQSRNASRERQDRWIRTLFQFWSHLHIWPFSARGVLWRASRLIDFLPCLEESSNVFCSNIASPKPFLLGKSVDSSPVDQATRNLSCDYLPMLNSFRLLYRFNLNDPRIISQYQGLQRCTRCAEWNMPTNYCH